MSSRKSATTRLSLLAGTSLAAAVLSAGVFTGASLSPTRALAVNECTPIGVDPSANGSTADSYQCTDAFYGDGITYTSDGDLSVSTTQSFVRVEQQGVSLTGVGSDSVTWDSTAGFLISYSPGANAPVIDVTTDTGDINIAASSVGGQGTSTQAIRAISTGGGAVSIIYGGADAFFGTNPGVTVEARSAGGDIFIAGGGTIGQPGAILAATSGLGNVTLNITGDMITALPGQSGVAAGPVIQTTADVGQTNIAITNGRIWTGSQLDSSRDPNGLVIVSSSDSTSSTALNIQNSGGTIYGAVDFSGVAGGVVFNNSATGRWLAGGASVLGAGSDTLTFDSDVPAAPDSPLQQKILAGASIDFRGGDDVMNVLTALDIGDLSDVGALLQFGAGTDTVNNSGILAVDGPVTFANLEAFNNSGVLYLGAKRIGATPIIDFGNGNITTGDILSMPGATFTGSGLSRLVAAVHFDSSTQAGCASPTGAADCLYLPGGATAGSTLLTLINAGADATQGAFNPTGVTVVDVNGGTSHASDFTLDPNSAGYVIDPRYGGVISRPGLFVYSLRYDAANQRHKVVGLPRSETMEYALLGSAAQSVWHMTTDTVNNRQTDLRAGSEGDVWVRASGEYSKRDVATDITSLSDTFTFDDSYKQYAGTIMGGMDFAHGGNDGYSWVFGGQIGYVSSSFDLDASPSSGRLTGGTGGVYGSFWSDRLFFDGTVNSNFLTLDYDAPGLGSKTNTWVRSVGAQLDSGMRFMLTDTVFAEPLATFSFARTTFEELSLAGGEVKPADGDSRRAALGLRVGADLLGGPLNVRYYVAGRAWHEFAGNYKGIVANPGLDVPLTDDASGSFGEANAGISIFNDDRTATGFLDAGAKFGDGYSAVDLNLGVRLRW